MILSLAWPNHSRGKNGKNRAMIKVDNTNAYLKQAKNFFEIFSSDAKLELFSDYSPLCSTRPPTCDILTYELLTPTHTCAVTKYVSVEASRTYLKSYSENHIFYPPF